MTTARVAAVAARVLGAAAIVFAIGTAARSPEMPIWLTAISLASFAAAAWRPASSLPFVIAVAPFGAWLAAVPVRATEAILCAFLAGWLLRLREPLVARPDGRHEPAQRVPRTVLAPALAFATAVAASWVVIVAERSIGLAAWPFTLEIMRTLPADYFVTAGLDPQTAAALQLLMMIATGLAVVSLSARDDRLPRRVAVAVAAAGLFAGVATLVDIPVRYIQSNYDPNELMRYFRGSRFSIHMSDLNAAGSHYALAGLVALAFARERRPARVAWLAGVCLLVPALWLSGSRTAMLAAALALALAWSVSRGWLREDAPTALSRRSLVTISVCILVLAAAVSTGLALRGREASRGTAAWSMSLREQFLITSARMVASAPVFGVGVGKYYERSGEFMPPQIREIYRGHENAHNYFAQVIAELGAIGGGLFVWLVCAALAGVWRSARAQTDYELKLALMSACVAFLVTCIAGHPLLVIEAAIPFWAALGAGLAFAATGASAERAAGSRRTALAAAIVIVATLPIRAAERLNNDAADFTPRGLHDERRDQSGQVYRWTSEHAVIFVEPEPGLVVLPVRAQHVPGIDQPFELTVAVSGRVDTRVTVPADRWLPVEVALRGEAPSRMRRLDLRVNQTWSAKRNFGDPSDARPMGVMLGRVDYQPRPTAETRSPR